MALDSAEIETAISFLEADPYFFRSGYMKEEMWGRLKKAQLSPKQLSRLEAEAPRHFGDLSTMSHRTIPGHQV
jgi:hypothetical protein